MTDITLGFLEMKILGIFKEYEQLTIQDVKEKLENLGKTATYTTVTTVLSRLYGKKLLTRVMKDRRYHYFQRKSTKSKTKNFISKIHDSLLGTNRLHQLVSLIQDSKDISKDDLEKLRTFINQKLKEVKKDNG